MGPVNTQLRLSLRYPLSTLTFWGAVLLVILVFLGSDSSISMAQNDEKPTAEDLTPVETTPGTTSGEEETPGSESSQIPSIKGDEENGDELTTSQPDITPAMDDSDPAESEPKTSDETSNGIETEQVTKVVILVQGKGEDLNPIRGAEVFVSIKDHDDVETSTNAKGLANISIPSGRVKIQVTAKDWKTFGEFYELNSESEEIKIILESRKPGGL